MLYRILELGYGKEIEDILNILGSKQQKSVGKGNSSQVSGVQRQNLLLSATLNEKVNHLAEISLDNPVTVGIDEKIELQLTHEDAEPMEFNGCDILVKDGKPLNSSAEEYKLPTQLLQRYMKGMVRKYIFMTFSKKYIFTYYPDHLLYDHKSLVVFYSQSPVVLGL